MQKISKNILFNIFLIFFLCGIFFNNIFSNFFLSLFFLSIFLSLISLVFFFNKKFLDYFIILFIIFFSSLIWIFVSEKNIALLNSNLTKVQIYDDNKYHNFSWKIIDLYKKTDFDSSYILELKTIDNKKINSKILWIIKIPNNYKLEFWDIIKTKAKIQIIRDFSDFSYSKFMLSKNIYFKSNLFSLEKIWKEKQNIILQKINKTREKLLDIIYLIYPKQEAIFLGGILLWARENLPDSLKQNFNNSGLTHFIAVSGFNIAILIIFFSYIFKFIPIYFRTILMIVIIILFSLLVWLSAPVLRASIMWALAYIIMSFWRKSENITLVLLTASIMVFLSPYILNYDVSFALSFLAVLWILYTQDFFKKLFSFLPEFMSIKEAFILTMSAFVFTLPIMAINFWQISIVAPLTNILVSWTIPIAMLLWFLSIIFYLIFPILGYIIWFVAYLFLSFDIFIVNFFWSSNYSVVKLNLWELKNFLEVFYFLLIIFLVLLFRKEKSKNIKL